MRSFPADLAHVGDYATPHELNAEIAEGVSVMHSLDWYNFVAGSLTVDKLAVGAAGDILLEGTNVLRSVVASAETLQSDVFAVPNAAGNPWIRAFTCGDGILRCACGGSARDVTLQITPVWVGLRIDGQIIGRSSSPARGVIHWQFEVDYPVGAGDHTLEVVFGSDLLFGIPTQFDFYRRQVSVREIAR